MKESTIHFCRLPAAGVQLHMAQAGQGSPVLLLHGFPDHWRLWEPLMDALATGHHLTAPDLRGINLSDKPSAVADYGIRHLVNDVVALIAQLGGRCALVGHDWGGMLAWAVAALHPDRVSRLVVFNAPHPCRFAEQLKADPAQRAASGYVRRLCEPGAESRLAERQFELLWAVRSGGRDDQGERAHCTAAWSQPGALTGALNWYRALDFDAALSPTGIMSVPDLMGASGVVDVPTLVVWGDRDGSFPAQCLDGLERWVPRLRIHRETEGGHWLLREQPALAADLLASFLAEEF
ncbi:MAG: alpha/beta hydrolase [Ideonella sp.]|nr:alpha/beta hydrolase [Ideonella sp.]